MSIIDEMELSRISGKSKNTIVLVGNGAIEGGWGPLRVVLDRWIDGDVNLAPSVRSLRRQNSEAFHQLAILSYKFKVARAELFLAWKKKKETPHQTEEKGFHNLVRGFLDLRAQIAASYKLSANKLSLKCSPYIQQLIGDNAAYVTTNWDETLWNDDSIQDLVQLHGRCSYDHSIVFPTELLIEDTPYDPDPFNETLGACTPAFQAEACSVFRYPSMQALFSGLTTTTEWLQKCERLIIWGYSLGDYDADINAAIGTYLPLAAKELIVINPDPSAFRRAVALTGITNAIHFDPITETTMRMT